MIRLFKSERHGNIPRTSTTCLGRTLTTPKRAFQVVVPVQTREASSGQPAVDSLGIFTTADAGTTAYSRMNPSRARRGRAANPIEDHRVGRIEVDDNFIALAGCRNTFTDSNDDSGAVTDRDDVGSNVERIGAVSDGGISVVEGESLHLKQDFELRRFRDRFGPRSAPTQHRRPFVA